jgi:hypothetical protein
MLSGGYAKRGVSTALFFACRARTHCEPLGNKQE